MRVAALQYTATSDCSTNLMVASKLIDDAVKDDATFITLPECANLIASHKDQLFADAKPEAQTVFLQMLQDKAIQHHVWLSAGSLMIAPEQQEADRRIANRHYIINPKGDITARYDKIHMFDAKIAGDRIYRESDSFKAGSDAVIADIDGHKTGLSICYDIRFGSLYRHYARQEAEMILIPAAFTKLTGQAHWHVLQRSRAIETGAFVISAAQTGTHDDGRQTYGHALIISPWGEIVSDAGEDGDMAIATLDFTACHTARNALSAWSKPETKF